MDATVIGRVAVKVVPKTDDFRREAKRDLDAAEEGLRVDVEMEARTAGVIDEVRRTVREAQARAGEITLRMDLTNRTEVEAALRQIERQQDRLRERTEISVDLNRDDLDAAQELLEEQLGKIQLDLEIEEKERRRIQREIDSFDATIEARMGEASLRETQARLAFLSRRRIADIYPRINELALARAEATLLALTGARAIGNIFDNLADSLGRLDKNALKIGGISLAVANLSGWLLTATSNTFTFGASLASIAGTSLALPGILGGLGLGIGATIAVLKDFNDVLPEVGDKLGALQNAMSSTFWQKAEAPFRSFIDTIFPQFAAGMDDTASALGDYFANLASSAEGTLNGALGSMFDDLGQSILIAGNHTDSLLGIIQKLGAVGAGNLPALSEWFGSLLDDFDGWLTDKGPRGLQEFIDNGTAALQDLGGVLAETGSIFAGVARAAEKAGGSTLSTMRETLSGAADAVNSDTFQASIAQAFRAAHEGMSEIARQSGDSFQSLMQRLSDTLDQVLPSAGRSLGLIFNGVFDALDQDRVQEALTGAFDSLEGAFGKIAGTLDEVALGLAGIIDVAAALVTSIAGSLAPLLEDLGPKVAEVSVELLPLIDALGELASIIATVVGAGLDIIPAQLIVLGGALGALMLVAPKVRAATASMTAGFTAVSAAVSRFLVPIRTLPASVATVATTMATAGARTQREAARMSTALAGISRAMSTVGLGVGALAFSMSSADEAMGLTNTAMGVLIGSMFGFAGAAVGAAVGGFLDIRAAAKKADDQAQAFNRTLADPDAGFAAIQDSLQVTVSAYEDYVAEIERLSGDVGASLGKVFSEPTDALSQFIDAMDGTDDRLAKARAAAADANSAYFQLGNTLGEISYELGNLDAFDGPDPNISYGVPQLKELEAISAQLKPTLDQLGVSFDDIANMDAAGIEALKAQVVELVREADSPAGRMDGFTDALADIDNASLTASVSADALKKSLDALLNPTLDAEAAMDAYYVALQDMNKQLGSNNAGFEGFSEAALANKEATRETVAQFQEYLVTQAELGASSERIAGLVGRARQAFIDEGVAAGRSAAEMEARANALKLTPKLVRTVFQETGIDLTQRQIRNLIGTLGKLPKRVQTFIENRGIDAAIAEVGKIDGKLGDLTKRQRRIILRLSGDDEVKGQLDKVKDSTDNLQITTKTQLTAKDDATPVIDKATGKAKEADKQNPQITVSVDDKATGPLAAIAQRVRELDAMSATVTATHITNYVTRRSNAGGGGSGRTSERTAGDASKRLIDEFRKNYERVLVRFQNDANNAFDKLLRKFSTKAQKTKIRSMFLDDLRALTDLEKLHKNLMKQYDQAAATLRRYRDERLAFIESTRAGLIASADVTQLGALTFDGIIRGMERARERALRFRDVIRQLIKDGLNKTTLEQILAAGPEAGLAVAESILSGGVDMVNDIQKDINKAAEATATAGGNALFGDLVKNAQKDVNKLLRELVPLQQKIAKFVGRLMDALSKQLKAKAIKLSLGDIVEVKSGDKGGKGKGKGGNKADVVIPRSASKNLTAAASGGTVINSGKTIIYNAAPNQSLDSEESLFDALAKTGAW